MIPPHSPFLRSREVSAQSESASGRVPLSNRPVAGNLEQLPGEPATSSTNAARAGIRSGLKLGHWVARELGLPADRHLGYARSVALAAFDVRGGGPTAVCAKVRRDLMSAGLPYPAGFFAEKLGGLVLEAEAYALAHRTELLFFVMRSRDGWMIRADNLTYGCFDCPETALAGAVHEAQAAGLLGFASSVLAQSTAGQPYETQWTFGSDPYPP